MSNRILVRSGQGIPTTENLEELELGFDTIGKKLYIKYNNEILPIGPTKQEIVDSICEVGHILITTNPEHPSTYLGGEWEIFGPGKTLIGIDSENENFKEVEKTGGIREIDLTHEHKTLNHTLTVSEIPNHNHTMNHSHSMNHGHEHNFYIASSGSHYHNLIYENGQQITLNGGSKGGYRLSWTSGKSAELGDARTDYNGSHQHNLRGSIYSYSGSTSDYVGSTGNKGSGNGHNHGNTESALSLISIQNPYITVYMWKRLS